jgi:hypothetical protein
MWGVGPVTKARLADAGLVTPALTRVVNCKDAYREHHGGTR